MNSSGVSIQFHGAAGTVTGSCFEIRGAGKAIIVDCGMFQGTRSLEKLNYEELPFDARDVDAMVLSHAHLDHSGRLPCLVVDGGEVPTYMTQATADILQPLLIDSAKLQAASAERRNRRADRAGMAPFVPLYTGDDVNDLYRHIEVIDFGEQVDLGDGVAFRLWDAGHIVGSASVEIEIGGQRILISGDIGSNVPVSEEQRQLGSYDHIICESTYGDRDREPMPVADRRERLAEFVDDTIDAGGNLLIPAFAVERTQAILEDLASLFNTKRLHKINVFLDAPLAQKVTKTILHHRARGIDLMNHPNIRFIQSVEESKRLNRLSGVIIIAGSGMCEGGRIRHHLLRNLPRRQSRVLFTGYQAAGTLGSVLRGGARSVRMSGHDVMVQAEIDSLDGYSNHADRQGLLKWIADRGPASGSIFLVHGEDDSLNGLAADLAAGGSGPQPIIPELGETWSLAPASPAERLAEGRQDAGKLVAPRDWASRLAEFRSSFEHKVRALESDEDREKLLAGLKRALDAMEQ